MKSVMTDNMSAVYICWTSPMVAVHKNSVWLPGTRRTVDWAQTLVGIVTATFMSMQNFFFLHTHCGTQATMGIFLNLV